MENAPGVVQAVPFREVSAPLQGREGPTEAAVLRPAVHQAHFRIVELAIVLCSSLVGRKFFLRLTQRQAQLPDAPVVIGVFQRAGGVLADAHVAGHVAQRVVVLPAQAAGRAGFRMHGMSIMHHGLPELVYVVAADAFEVRVGHYGGAVVAHHAATVPRRCPFRQETAFQEIVHQSLLHAGRYLRIHQVQQREKAAEGVPEAGVGEEVALLHLPVMRAVVYPITGSVYFRKIPREEQAAVEAAIEGAKVVQIPVPHLHAAQGLVPLCAGLGLHSLKAAGNLLKVQERLLRRYERRSHLQVNLLAPLRAETHQGHVFAGRAGSERSVRAHYEPVAETLRHAAMVVDGVANEGVLVGHLYVPAFEGVHHQVGLPFRIGETESGRVGRGRELRRNVMVCQIDAVIIRCSLLCLVREPAGTGIFLKHRPGGDGHDGESAVVVDPGAGLVRLLETADVMGVVAVGPAVSVAAGLRGPEMGAPRHGHRRVGIAGGEFEGGERTAQRIHIVHGVQALCLRGLRAASPRQERHKGKKVLFHTKGFRFVKVSNYTHKKKRGRPISDGLP